MSEHGVKNVDRSGREDLYSAKAKKVVLRATMSQESRENERKQDRVREK